MIGNLSIRLRQHIAILYPLLHQPYTKSYSIRWTKKCFFVKKKHVLRESCSLFCTTILVAKNKLSVKITGFLYSHSSTYAFFDMMCGLKRCQIIAELRATVGWRDAICVFQQFFVTLYHYGIIDYFLINLHLEYITKKPHLLKSCPILININNII